MIFIFVVEVSLMVFVVLFCVCADFDFFWVDEEIIVCLLIIDLFCDWDILFVRVFVESFFESWWNIFVN